jgi:hypothetical protein
MKSAGDADILVSDQAQPSFGISAALYPFWTEGELLKTHL